MLVRLEDCTVIDNSQYIGLLHKRNGLQVVDCSRFWTINFLFFFLMGTSNVHVQSWIVCFCRYVPIGKSSCCFFFVEKKNPSLPNMAPKVIQIRIDQVTRKRKLVDSERLRTWVDELGKECGVHFAEYLLDDEDVETSFNDFDLIETDVVFHLRVFKKRLRDEGVEEKLSILQQMIQSSDFASAWPVFCEIAWSFCRWWFRGSR